MKCMFAALAISLRCSSKIQPQHEVHVRRVGYLTSVLLKNPATTNFLALAQTHMASTYYSLQHVRKSLVRCVAKVNCTLICFSAVPCFTQLQGDQTYKKRRARPYHGMPFRCREFGAWGTIELDLPCESQDQTMVKMMVTNAKLRKPRVHPLKRVLSKTKSRSSEV